MQRKLTATIVTLALLAALGASASAAIDTSTFSHKYEMDAAPSASDLDSNSTQDFYAGTTTIPGDVLSNASYSGGTGIIKDDNTNTNSSVFRTDFGNSIWRNLYLGDTDWMAEIRVKVIDDGQYPEGAAGSLLMSGGISGNSPILRIHTDQIDFSSGAGSYTTYMTTTDFTANFHTFLIGRQGNLGYLWVDGNLVAASQAIITGLGGGHADGFFVGGESFSSGVNGSYEIDYIRLNTEFIPAPAALPAGLALLGLVALKRRK